MAFRSEAHRRWWFANREAGGTGVLKSLSTGGPSADARQAAKEREVAYMASPSRRLERAQYAQAMFPHLSEADALRTLNDREG